MIIKNGFAYVEPRSAPSAPVADRITRRATALHRRCSQSGYVFRGQHSCTGRGCSARSDNRDYFLPDGRKTHSLMIHYVACHRDAVPGADIAYLDGQTDEAHPTDGELLGTGDPDRRFGSGPAPAAIRQVGAAPDPRRIEREIRDALDEKQKQTRGRRAPATRRSRIIDSFDAPGLNLVYEVSVDDDRLPGDPGRFVVTARYLSDGREAADEPLRFVSRDRAIATARLLSQHTVMRADAR